MTYGHLQADCLYTGISSGPNARCRVWEAFTFTFFLYVFTVFDYYLNERFYIYDQYYINNIVLKYAYMSVLIKS